MWKTIEAEGCTWQVRAVNNPDTGTSPDEEIVEFSAQNQNRPPRRLVMAAGAIDGMDEAALRAAFIQARPIGGDHYGRPGKRMGDTAGA